MSEIARVIEALEHAAAGDGAALASVVATTGPAYRRPGARMVVRRDGSWVGGVSAGCMERDLARRAERAIATGRPELVAVDGRGDDEMQWGNGCGGLMEVLIEPLDAAACVAHARLLRAAETHAPDVQIVTVYRSAGAGAPREGARLLVRGDGDSTVELGDWGDGRARAVVLADLWQSPVAGASADKRYAVRDCCGAVTEVAACVERPARPTRLVICGSGADAEPLSRMAVMLGWSVTVVDHRPVTDDARARFGGALVVECAEAEQIATKVELGPATAVVVMSHHFARDTAYVGAVLPHGPAYVGVLGPRARTARLLADLATRPGSVASIDAVHGPAGLDLGGDGPEAIALAIAAEVQAVLSGRNAAALRERESAIHVEPRAEAGPVEPRPEAGTAVRGASGVLPAATGRSAASPRPR